MSDIKVSIFASAIKKNMPKGIKHWNWKGHKAKHSAKHSWVRTHFGKADKCENLICEKLSNHYEWANLSGKYHRKQTDFKMMCRKCHSKMDKSKFCRNGHKRTNKNTYFHPTGGYRRCRICQAIEKGWKNPLSRYSVAQ